MRFGFTPLNHPARHRGQIEADLQRLLRIRERQVGKVHIAKKQLGLDDETYRGILAEQFNKDSASKLSDRHLTDLIEHFKTLGFKGQPKRGRAKSTAPARADTPALDREKQIRKIRALWVSLHCLGILRDGSEKALTAFAKRVSGGKDTGIASLNWLHGEAIYKVTEALKAMAAREAGVDWSAHQVSTSSGIVPVYRPRCRVLEAQWRIGHDLGVVKIRDLSALDSFARGAANHPAKCGIDQLTNAEQDIAIAALGRMIRGELKDLGFATLQDWRKSERRAR